MCGVVHPRSRDSDSRFGYHDPRLKARDGDSQTRTTRQQRGGLVSADASPLKSVVLRGTYQPIRRFVYLYVDDMGVCTTQA